MRVEVRDSLVVTWLKHVKQCQIVQSHWRVNIHCNDLQDSQYKSKLLAEVSQSEELVSLVKNEVSFMAQCDVMGMSLREDGRHWKAVVFLPAGEITPEVVEDARKQIIKLSLAMTLTFRSENVDVMLVSMDVSDKDVVLKKMEDDLQTLFSGSSGASFHLCLKNAFRDTVLLPVLKKRSEIADTNELFMRGIQLSGMFEPKGKTGRKKLPGGTKKKAEKANMSEGSSPKAIGRIPGWASKGSCNPHLIIRAFLMARGKGDSASFATIKKLCTEDPSCMLDRPDGFNGSWNSLKTDKGNSNGKVFDQNARDDRVALWPPVADLINQYSDQFLK